MIATAAQEQTSIAMLTASASRLSGGLFEAVRPCAHALAVSGVNVSVYSSSDERTGDDIEEWAPLVPKVFSRRGPRAFAYAPDLSAALIAEPPDLAHQHGLWLYPSMAVSRFRAATGRPSVVSPHGMLDPWALRNSAWKKRIARVLFEDRNLRNASCLHALNVSEAVSMRAFGLKNPIAIIPNGVTLPDMKATLPTRPVCLGIDDRRVALFLGRIHPKKGLSETLEAWALLKDVAPNVAKGWRLVVAGWDDGNHLSALKRQADDLGLSDDVTFPGPLFGPEKMAALAHSDAFILASHSEGLPMAVLEAWAHGLSVFMTEACNLPEGFDAGAAVKITTNPLSIARTLAEHLRDPDLVKSGRVGRRLVETRFTWDNVAAQHSRVYEWLVRGTPRPDCVIVD